MFSRVSSPSSLKDKQVEDIVELVLSAFSESELAVLPMVGGDTTLLPELYRLSVRTAALEGKVTVCEETKSARILSVSCSYGPGTFFLGSQKQRDLGFDDFFNKLSTEGKQWWAEYFERVKHMPSIVVDSWFVTILATATSEERKEYGSSVLREVQRIAAGDQTCVALNATSEKNVAFYSSLGFKVVHTAERTTPYGTWISYITTWSQE
ncbi:hypothetical protein CVT26_004303 [Gymnopilus dilepis]|uniref:N-acetyltransferase domain-containing protein n=1 Tax=Gymnopilus dilepis TaxID=231916 RepID=A0A409WPT3_9AGAR|nr:hypothetical protein CVT26_004303 [Gymnopilus dilepis]